MTRFFLLPLNVGLVFRHVLGLDIFLLQTVGNLIERRLFESKESKWVHHAQKIKIISHDGLCRSAWLTLCVKDQCLISVLLDWQASAGEIPANRGHSGISAGQWGRAWAADGGRGDDHCYWKATAGGLTASYQQVSAQNKSTTPFCYGDNSHYRSLPFRLDSAENQVDESIFLIESYVTSTASTSWGHYNLNIVLLKVFSITFCEWMVSKYGCFIVYMSGLMQFAVQSNSNK